MYSAAYVYDDCSSKQPHARTHTEERTHLVINQQLDGVVAPLDEDDLVSLARHSVGEGGPDAGTGAGLEPHAHGEGVHLRQALLDAAVQVVGAKGEGHLEVLR